MVLTKSGHSFETEPMRDCRRTTVTANGEQLFCDLAVCDGLKYREAARADKTKFDAKMDFARVQPMADRRLKRR